MKKTKNITRWSIGIALGLAISGVAYAASTNWIFCTSFESGGPICSAGVGPIEQEPGTDGNLWDQMHWNSGQWQ